jgi:hypothetical protein
MTWFVSFAAATCLAIWMRHLGYSWPSILGAAVVAYAVLSLLIWQLSDAVVLRRLRRIRQD